MASAAKPGSGSGGGGGGAGALLGAGQHQGKMLGHAAKLSAAIDDASLRPVSNIDRKLVADDVYASLVKYAHSIGLTVELDTLDKFDSGQRKHMQFMLPNLENGENFGFYLDPRDAPLERAHHLAVALALHHQGLKLNRNTEHDILGTDMASKPGHAVDVAAAHISAHGVMAHYGIDTTNTAANAIVHLTNLPEHKTTMAGRVVRSTKIASQITTGVHNIRGGIQPRRDVSRKHVTRFSRGPNKGSQPVYTASGKLVGRPRGVKEAGPRSPRGWQNRPAAPVAPARPRGVHGAAEPGKRAAPLHPGQPGRPAGSKDSAPRVRRTKAQLGHASPTKSRYKPTGKPRGRPPGAKDKQPRKTRSDKGHVQKLKLPTPPRGKKLP